MKKQTLIIIALCALILSLTLDKKTKAQEGSVYQLGPQIFNIPPGYVVAYHPAGDVNNSGAITILALLPELQPRSANNSWQFDRADSGSNTIVASIYFNSPLLFGRELLSTWQRAVPSGGAPSAVGDFLVYRLGGDSAFNSLYIHKSRMSPEFFTCMNDMGPRDASRLKHCEIIFSLATPTSSINGRPLFVVDYSVPKTQIDAISSIDEKLRQLITDFMFPHQ